MRDDWGQQFLEPEQVPVDENDPRKADHELLLEFQKSLRLRECQENFAGNWLFEQMLQLPPVRRIDLIETAQVRIRYTMSKPLDLGTPQGMSNYQGTFPLKVLVKRFLDSPIKLEDCEMERLMTLAARGEADSTSASFPVGSLLIQIEQFRDRPELMAKWRPLFCELRQKLSSRFISNVGSKYKYGGNTAMQGFAELLGTQVEGFLERGDAWADCAIADLEAMDSSERALWRSLFDYARQSKDGKPKEKWLKQADSHLQQVGKDLFLRRIQSWFPLYGKDDGWWFADREERNDAFFKGLVWMSSRIEDAAAIPVLGAALRGSF